jgi:hypothetical protein
MRTADTSIPTGLSMLLISSPMVSSHFIKNCAFSCQGRERWAAEGQWLVYSSYILSAVSVCDERNRRRRAAGWASRMSSHGRGAASARAWMNLFRCPCGVWARGSWDARAREPVPRKERRQSGGQGTGLNGRMSPDQAAAAPRRVTNHAKVQNRTSSIARSRCRVGLPCQPAWSLKPFALRAPSRRRRRWWLARVFCGVVSCWALVQRPSWDLESPLAHSSPRSHKIF